MNENASVGLETYDVNLKEVEFITQESFEYVVSFLYSTSLEQHQQLNKHRLLQSKDSLNFMFSVIAMSSYLSAPTELTDYHTSLIMQRINKSTIGSICQFASYHDYGPPVTQKILDSCRGWLCSYGWVNASDSEVLDNMSVWDDIPTDVIKEVVTSDMFFISNEYERSLFVIELINRREMNQQNNSRIEEDEQQEDEQEIETLHQILNTPGLISYVHMSASQLHHLESLKGKSDMPIIKTEILKNAFWDSFRLRKIITSSSQTQKTLGICSEGYLDSNKGENNVWIVPVKDETIYDTPEALKLRFKENNTSPSSPQIHKLSIYPPYRFSVHFTSDQLLNLPCDKRIYSQTIWYMGSHWNLYVQKIRTKKGTYQMGVYLHRATNGSETAHEKGGSDISIARDLSTMSINDDRDPDLTRITQGSPESDEDEDEDEISTKNTGQSRPIYDEDAALRYTDPRAEVNTYYKIHTPTNISSISSSSSSKKKRNHQPFSITCFASTPDVFNKSQSWGWKSNSMCGFDDVGNVLLDGGSSSGNGNGNGLRFMVCLGLV